MPFFAALILLVALLMEGVGSYISVVGLSSLFSGDWVIIAMAVILDVAKVTSVSFVYQYWVDIKLMMKTYLLAAVMVLMVITSAGAFGYLSAAFQKAMQPNVESSLKVDALKREMTSLLEEKKELTETKQRIQQQIAKIPTTEEDTARRRLISSFKPEIDRASKRLDVVNPRIDALRGQVLAAESENVEKTVHAGPITYVSKAFNLSLEDASKYIILLIVGVFDPLAIALVISANFIIAKRREERLKLAPVVSYSTQEAPKPEPAPPVPRPVSKPDDVIIVPPAVPSNLTPPDAEPLPRIDADALDNEAFEVVQPPPLPPKLETFDEEAFDVAQPPQAPVVVDEQLVQELIAEGATDDEIIEVVTKPIEVEVESSDRAEPAGFIEDVPHRSLLTDVEADDTLKRHPGNSPSAVKSLYAK